MQICLSLWSCPETDATGAGKKSAATAFRSHIKKIRLGLAVVLVAGICLGKRAWLGFELFPDLFGLAGSLWFWTALTMVVISIWFPLLRCRALCPTGAFLDMLSALSLGKKYG